MHKTIALAALIVMSASGVRAGETHDSASVYLPTFGLTPWGFWSKPDDDRWNGNYLRLSSGFSATSVRKGPTIAGPTIGLEAGKFWRDGSWVYGAVANFEAMPTMARMSSAAFPILTENFNGGAHLKSGYLVQPNVLVYGRVGVTAYNETWRLPTSLGGGKDSRLVIRPDMRVGAQWAVTDNLSVTVEVGIQPPLR